MEIGKKIKNRRLELNLTMRELAEKSNVSEATVSRWESGDIANMRRDKIVLLANALEVHPSFIMEESEPSSPKNSKQLPNADQLHILNKYSKLNTMGQQKADEYIDDLLENPKYTKPDAINIAAKETPMHPERKKRTKTT